MGIVSFDRIAKVLPDQTTSLDPAGSSSTPFGPTSVVGRTTLFDSLWGYFTFTQDLGMDYGQGGDVYESAALFSITGSFTKDAVMASKNATAGDVTFSALTAKYEALKAVFNNAAHAGAPTNLSDWNGPNDPRVIVLPLPLLDKDGNRIYATPVEITLEPGQFPVEVKYRAQLREVEKNYTQVIVNGRIIDDAVIVIDVWKPIISRSQLVACVGEAIQVLNYSALEVEVSGTTPIAPASGESTFLQPSGHLIGRGGRELLNALQGQTVNIQLAVPSGGTYTTVPLYTNMTRVGSTSFDFAHEEGAVQVSVRCRE